MVRSKKKKWSLLEKAGIAVAGVTSALALIWAFYSMCWKKSNQNSAAPRTTQQSKLWSQATIEAPKFQKAVDQQQRQLEVAKKILSTSASSTVWSSHCSRV
jgi:hypothetical protein